MNTAVVTFDVKGSTLHAPRTAGSGIPRPAAQP